jgi:saccharopine dehydrogenase (NAD+, L-lysine forming)
MNAVDPRFVMPIFSGAYAAGADYLDMAMSLSRRHPEAPYEKIGVKLGDEQFARADEWEKADRLALVGIGVESGLSDVSPATRLTTCSPRSTSWAPATAPTW